MSHLTEQFFAETGDKAMYRMKSSDYHTLRYVKWLEAKVENGSSHNNAMPSCQGCGLEHQSKINATCSICARTHHDYWHERQ